MTVGRGGVAVPDLKLPGPPWAQPSADIAPDRDMSGLPDIDAGHDLAMITKTLFFAKT
jgi:hypothetical protein